MKTLLLKWLLKHTHITVTRGGERLVDTSYSILKSGSLMFPFNSVEVSIRHEKVILTFEVK